MGTSRPVVTALWRRGLLTSSLPQTGTMHGRDLPGSGEPKERTLGFPAAQNYTGLVAAGFTAIGVESTRNPYNPLETKTTDKYRRDQRDDFLSAPTRRAPTP